MNKTPKQQFTLGFINTTYHRDDIIRDTMLTLLKEKKLLEVFEQKTFWSNMIPDLKSISQNIPGVVFILTTNEAAPIPPTQLSFLNGSCASLLKMINENTIETDEEAKHFPKYELCILYEGNAPAAAKITVFQKLLKNNVLQHLNENNAVVKSSWPDIINSLANISGQLPGFVLMLNRCDDPEQKTHRVYFANGKRRDINEQPINPYIEELTKLFGTDFDLNKNVTEIPSNNGQKVFLIYANSQIQLLKLRCDIQQGIIVRHEAVYVCHTIEEYQKIANLIKTTIYIIK